MSALDIAIAVIMSYFLIRGIFRGLVKEVVGILGLFVAFWAASTYWPSGAEQLKIVLDSPAYRSIISFVVIYIIVYFLIGLMAIFVDKIVKLTITPLCSGLAGGALGVLKGSILCLILLTATNVFVKPEPGQEFYSDSILWPHIEPGCNQVRSWLPETLRRVVTQTGQVLTGELSKPPASATPASSSAQAALYNVPTDFFTLKTLVQAAPERISQVWLEKLSTIKPEEVDQELIRRFITDNRGLFERPSPGTAIPATQTPASAQTPTSSQTAPNWPRPANE
ncbi:MAG: CvpA family protein [Deltaproteobacteria bacterium]|jgi:membrane protein required for colicin V production|nr:CvpA family protein [Deltaproteobacteria bacterium]